MKKNLEILDFEEKVMKNGKPYTRFKTNGADFGEKWMSCFDPHGCNELNKLNKKTASVELVESGDFHNITKCYGEAEGSESLDNVEVEKVGRLGVDQIAEKLRKSVKGSAYEKDPVGLAVEIFVYLVGRLNRDLEMNDAEGAMDNSINLVKQAQEAFK